MSITNKNELIENIKQWVTIDSQLKIVNEKTKKMRDMKSELTQHICNYKETSNLKANKITISDGTLSFYEKKDYSPLTYTYVEKCLGELISDKKQVDYIIQYMKNNREVSISNDIRRTYDKTKQIEN
jgi:Zn/Cd-binding protein ZinT